MQRLLIVDDDVSTRNGLMRHIPWKKHGINMVQTAGSGQEALSICERFQPDIVLSDIRMRGMNGIEMCTVLHKKFPDCQIIFISGYSDKEYFKGAITLGAVSYVEKPVNPQELENAIQEAVIRARINQTRKSADERLSQNASYIKRETFLALLKGAGQTPELEKNIAYSKLLPEGSSPYRIYVIRTEKPIMNIRLFQDRFTALLEETEPDSGITILHGEFTDNRHLVLLTSGSEHPDLSESGITSALSRIAGKTVEGIRIFLSIGKQVHDGFQLDSSYKHACELERSVFFLGYGQMCCMERKKERIRFNEGLYDQFTGALTTGNEKIAEEILDQIHNILEDGEVVQSSFVSNIYFSLLSRIFQQYHRIFPDRQNDLEARLEIKIAELESIDTLETLHRFMFEQIQTLTEENFREEQNDSVVLQITRYIQQNYFRKELSNKSLAEQVYLTPTYLSYLFKQKTGITIGKYLTDTRIERAKELLKEKKFKLYQIAEQVGYDDPNYFAKIFKKIVGVTPSEYREWGC